MSLISAKSLSYIFTLATTARLQTVLFHKNQNLKKLYFAAMKNEMSKSDFHTAVIELLQAARTHVARVINNTMVYAYYEIGRKIVEEEQKGGNRAEYGKVF